MIGYGSTGQNKENKKELLKLNKIKEHMDIA